MSDCTCGGIKGIEEVWHTKNCAWKPEPAFKKLMWLIEVLLGEQPRRLSDLLKSTGLCRRDVEDAVWELVQEGRIRIRSDSVMEKI